LKESKANISSVYVGVDKPSYVVDEGEWVNPPDYVMQERVGIKKQKIVRLFLYLHLMKI
jgi:hypothetical protein